MNVYQENQPGPGPYLAVRMVKFVTVKLEGYLRRESGYSVGAAPQARMPKSSGGIPRDGSQRPHHIITRTREEGVPIDPDRPCPQSSMLHPHQRRLASGLNPRAQCSHAASSTCTACGRLASGRTMFVRLHCADAGAWRIHCVLCCIALAARSRSISWCLFAAVCHPAIFTFR